MLEGWEWIIIGFFFFASIALVFAAIVIILRFQSGKKETKETVIKEFVMILCQNCGSLTPQTAQYCPNCGIKRNLGPMTG